jgi:hypothetical protein
VFGENIITSNLLKTQINVQVAKPAKKFKVMPDFGDFLQGAFCLAMQPYIITSSLKKNGTPRILEMKSLQEITTTAYYYLLLFLSTTFSSSSSRISKYSPESLDRSDSQLTNFYVTGLCQHRPTRIYNMCQSPYNRIPEDESRRGGS